MQYQYSITTMSLTVRPLNGPTNASDILNILMNPYKILKIPGEDGPQIHTFCLSLLTYMEDSKSFFFFFLLQVPTHSPELQQEHNKSYEEHLEA